jgi:hypothetical protein
MEMERSVADLGARLASIEKLEWLRQGERLLLLDELKETLGPRWLSIYRRRPDRTLGSRDRRLAAQMLRGMSNLEDEEAAGKTVREFLSGSFTDGQQAWESAKTKDKAEARWVLQSRLGS